MALVLALLTAKVTSNGLKSSVNLRGVREVMGQLVAGWARAVVVTVEKDVVPEEDGALAEQGVGHVGAELSLIAVYLLLPALLEASTLLSSHRPLSVRHGALQV
jgi:hypothetical protein